MSEVGDAVQVVMLCGRGAMLIGNISLKLAMQFVKLLNTIYLAKWEGSVSLNRLRFHDRVVMLTGIEYN